MKRMYTLIALLVAFLGVVRQRTPKVGVLTLMHHPALDQIYKGYVDELGRLGYHDGKNIKIEYQNANGDQSNLKTMAGKLVNDNCNVIYGITTPAAQASLARLRIPRAPALSKTTATPVVTSVGFLTRHRSKSS